MHSSHKAIICLQKTWNIAHKPLLKGFNTHSLWLHGKFFKIFPFVFWEKVKSYGFGIRLNKGQCTYSFKKLQQRINTNRLSAYTSWHSVQKPPMHAEKYTHTHSHMKWGRGLLVFRYLTVALKHHAPRGLHIKQAKFSVFFINSLPLCVSWVAAVMAASNTNLPTETKGLLSILLVLVLSPSNHIKLGFSEP